MRKRKLPTGIQTFRLIREEGCYYVDKTPFAHRLVTEGSLYFLSRPRRFGKRLFVDTLRSCSRATSRCSKVIGHIQRHEGVRLQVQTVR